MGTWGLGVGLGDNPLGFAGWDMGTWGLGAGRGWDMGSWGTSLGFGGWDMGTWFRGHGVQGSRDMVPLDQKHTLGGDNPLGFGGWDMGTWGLVGFRFFTCTCQVKIMS